MTKEINLSEILNKHLSACYIVHNIKISDKYQTHLIAAMREVAEKTLELASEKIKSDAIETCGSDVPDCWSDQSILNTINQIK